MVKSIPIISSFNHKLIILVHGILLISSCFIVGNYNITKNTKESLFTAFFIFGLAFSDLSAVVAYYYKIEYFFYLDRLTNIFALFAIVTHATITNTKEEINTVENYL